MEWYRKAAEQGYATAQFNLGLMYENGWGVDKNEATAVECYRKAANQGHADAQFYLGLMYECGLGVDKNHSTGVEWYRTAAGQGHLYAPKSFDRLTKQYSKRIGLGQGHAAAKRREV